MEAKLSKVRCFKSMNENLHGCWPEPCSLCFLCRGKDLLIFLQAELSLYLSSVSSISSFCLVVLQFKPPILVSPSVLLLQHWPYFWSEFKTFTGHKNSAEFLNCSLEVSKVPSRHDSLNPV
jgi:hypothetical protein